MYEVWDGDLLIDTVYDRTEALRYQEAGYQVIMVDNR